MIKLITLLKRRPGMSKQDFIAYYEQHHRLIGEKVLSGYATDYFRRFIEPTDGIDEDQDFDVVMEIWFPNEATRAACFARIGQPELMAEIVADEERLFDRSRIRSFTICHESASEMPSVG
jgi:hypothetical protein